MLVKGSLGSLSLSFSPCCRASVSCLSRLKGEKKSEDTRKGQVKGRGRIARRGLCPSLRDVSEAPGARLRSHRAHMGLMVPLWGLKDCWMPDDIMTDGNVSVRNGRGGLRRSPNNNVTNVSFSQRCPLPSPSARPNFPSSSIIPR